VSILGTVSGGVVTTSELETSSGSGTTGAVAEGGVDRVADPATLRGDVRFRILGEVARMPYRTARVVAQPEVNRRADEAYAQREWLADLAHQYLKYLPGQMAVPEIETVGLDALTNALIMSLNLEVEEKQKLLEIDDLIKRAEEIGAELQTRVESMRFLSPFRRGSDPSRN